MKARIISITVTPQIVIDDGDNLIPQPIKPMTIIWTDWKEFSAHGIQDALNKMQADLDARKKSQS